MRFAFHINYVTNILYDLTQVIQPSGPVFSAIKEGVGAKQGDLKKKNKATKNIEKTTTNNKNKTKQQGNL